MSEHDSALGDEVRADGEQPDRSLDPGAVARPDVTEAPLAEPPAPVWVRSDWYVCIGLVLVSFVLVGLHVRAYPTLSPIDELQHVDYVIRAGDLDIPHRNERVEFEAMSEAACRSVDAPEYVGPPCGLDEYDPEDFQERGFNTAASQFPPYYVVTGIGTRIIDGLGIFDSKVVAARMIGAAWMGAAWCVTWYLMALVGIRRRYRAAVLAVVVPAPLVLYHAGATVNADVALMLSGALAVLATMKYEAGRLRWWWLAPIYIGLYFVEATNILAITACALYLVARRGLDTALTWHRRLAPLLILPGLLLLRLEVGGRVHTALFPAAVRERPSERMSSAPMFSQRRVDGIEWDRVVDQVDQTFTPLRFPYLSPPVRSQATILGLELSNWLVIALMFVAALVIAAGPRIVWWARVTMVTLLAAGPFYTFYFMYNGDRFFPAPARFALPIVPLMVVVAAAAVRTRAVFYVTSAVGAYVALSTFVQLVAAQ